MHAGQRRENLQVFMHAPPPLPMGCSLWPSSLRIGLRSLAPAEQPFDGQESGLYGEAIAKLSYEDYQVSHCPDVWTVQRPWLLQVVIKLLNTADFTPP
jgi:hypothetical protein